MLVEKYALPNNAEYTYGKNLYILGTSQSGPILQPVHIKTLQHAQDIFGLYNEGTLIKAWNEAFQTGGTDINIFLVRISGEYAEFTMKARNMATYEAKEVIQFRSKYGGAQWNDLKMYITDTSLEIQNPDSVGGEIYVFLLEDYPTCGQLVEAINLTASSRGLHVFASVVEQFEPSENIRGYYRDNLWEALEFNFGEDGLNITKNQLHDCLEIAYNIIEGQPIDIISVASAYFDDISPLAYYGDKGYGELFYTEGRDYLLMDHPVEEDRPATFHGQLIDFCYQQANLSIITHGIMAFNPLENVEDLFEDQSYFMKAVNATCFSDRFDLITKSGKEITDHGKFISVVIGEFEYTSPEGVPYYGNGYLGYAALLTSKLTADSTTNMPIPNIKKLRYHINDSEIALLAKIGIVTFRYSIMRDCIVVCNGVTTAMEGSPYHTVSNVRMVQLVLASYKSLMDTYIGENVDKLKSTGSMDKAVQELAKKLKSDKIVRDMTALLNIGNTGVAVVNLDILTNYSIEYVSASGQTKL